jgi:DNA invertase Pin-like site-specific DNA recombinase
MLVLTNKPCNVYTRESRTNETHAINLQNQMALCLAKIKELGGTFKSSVSETQSAFSAKSSALNSLLLKKNTTLFVSTVDRFSRNMKTGLEYFELAKKNNVHLIFLREELCIKEFKDVDKIKLLEYLKQSEMESRNTGSRIKTARTFSELEGKHAGGRLPYGYTKDANNYLVKNDDEFKIKEFIILATKCNVTSKELNQEIIKIAPDAMQDISFYEKDQEILSIDKGVPLQNIANILNESDLNKRGKPWTASNVKSAMTNPVSLSSMSLDERANKKIKIDETEKQSGILSRLFCLF